MPRNPDNYCGPVRALDGTKHIYFYRPEDDYGWMSNFFEREIVIDFASYKSVEHYYQSEKAGTDELRDWIANAPTPHYAYKAGRSLRKEDMVGKWDDKKFEVMERAVRVKFEDLHLRALLGGTDDAYLHENSPRDMYWGVKGKDMLGRLLMQIRREIRESGKPLNSGNEIL